VEAVDAAEHGAVVYLVRGGRQIAAIVPPVVAAVGAAAVKALADIRGARVALADPDPDVPAS